ncbi:hypothetical protein K435DRAFT_845093 [Dendrothele bispora CBS 962.96]|uniref:DUF4100 domain-containing protein n=1 Tax=Dendrothele bispora (strain CBS 962.96) TaxID=1314807 RepID=A0A4V4HBR8_DENBC|nr:hypothetical protein K435DRAFT_845093 [Dendrothele bispora CBS 962.96]
MAETTTSEPSTSETSTPNALIFPMPVPGTTGAPHFDGVDADEFLDQILVHGHRAGITDHDKLVNYITSYSSKNVKRVIRYMPEFDKDENDKKWDTARTTLCGLYRSSNEPPEYTLDDLEDYCRKYSEKTSFTNKKAVDDYRQGFMTIAAPLKKNKKVTDQVVRIPASLSEWFENRVPVAKRNNTEPPTISESVEILYQRFDKSSLSFRPWENRRRDKSDSRVHFEDEDDTTTERVQTIHRDNTTRSTAPRSTRQDSPPPVMPTDNVFATRQEMDSITRQLEKLTLQLLANNPNNPNADNVVTCFICGLVHPSPRSPACCPETAKLLSERLITYNLERRRYLLPDGSELPRVPYGQPGGVAGLLRSQAQQGASTFRRDPPPHQPSQTASASPANLSYGRGSMLGGNVFAVASLNPEGDYYHVDPALRSGKDTNTRFNPIGDKRDKGKAKEVNPPVPGPSKPSSKPSIPAPSTRTDPANISIPPPQNPINRPDGWKASQPSRNPPTKDVTMKDDTRKTPAGPSYHFTSDLQEQFFPEAIMTKIMQTPITIPMGQLIGGSPQLQKLVADSTRTRREYNSSKPASTSLISTFDPFSAEDEEENALAEYRRGVLPSGLSVGKDVDLTDVSSFLVHYSSAVTTIPDTKYFAMVTGVMDVQVNGLTFSAMIDTGSELNVASMDFPTNACLPVDYEGMKWSLKGIHGGPERLAGVVTDVPFRLGNHVFPHHVFVTNHKINDRNYKPVHRKYRPVPTYMPNPEAQQFKSIPRATPLKLPKNPPHYKTLKFGNRVTLERLELMLSKIEPGLLRPQEIDLLAYVVVKREMAFAFEHSERGSFSREYYPDYEIPTIEHTPWQRPPIRVPKAIEQEVIAEVLRGEAAGRFEPTTSSYRSAMFAVAKKKGVRLVVSTLAGFIQSPALFKLSILQLVLNNRPHWYKVLLGDEICELEVSEFVPY